LAYDGVENAAHERKRLAIRSHWKKQRIAQPVPCTDKHRGGDIRPDYGAGRANGWERDQCRLACPGRDIEHSLPSRYLRSGDHRRHE
jgi:hypothetical protein